MLNKLDWRLANLSSWGCSSAGRAVALQATGRRFDPCHLHQLSEKIFKINLDKEKKKMIKR